jgi:ketosteroid isomerase-like protein
MSTRTGQETVGALEDKMSENKLTIERYIDGFNKTDHAQILSCLTDDVVWEMPGFFHHAGKAAFDREIENDAFVGTPIVTISRLVEEGDVVVAEGTVNSRKADGSPFKAAFCDVFEMRDRKISRLVGYLVEVK